MERNIKTVMQKRISYYENEIVKHLKMQKDALKANQHDYAEILKNDLTSFNMILSELLYLQREL